MTKILGLDLVKKDFKDIDNFFYHNKFQNQISIFSPENIINGNNLKNSNSKTYTQCNGNSKYDNKVRKFLLYNQNRI